ncbi:Uridine nucleosidase 1 [Myotisia sp. PD_48]|nr:Uridine nucleosidase 1 [Myotisia sp. PD_48]
MISKGLSGLDGTNLLPIPTTPPLHDKNAFVAMKDALLSQPKDTAWLVATGTLTNVAILFAAFPEVALHIRGLSIMGGAVGNGFTKVPISLKPGDSSRIGNITPWAEFNIYCDPESAQSIFSSPVLAPKTTLITLDLTHQVLATLDIQSLVLGGEASSDAEGKGFPSILRQILHALLIFFANTYDTVFGISAGPPLHDPLAVAVLLSNLNTDQANHMIGAGDVIKFDDGEGRRYNVNVVTDGQHSKDHDLGSQVGRIIATPVSNLEGTGGVTIPCSVDVNKFWAMIVSCLERADSWNLTRSQAK